MIDIALIWMFALAVGFSVWWCKLPVEDEGDHAEWEDDL